MKKVILLISLFFALTGISESNEVNIFSARHYDSDVQLYEKFTQKTGIKVNVVPGKDKSLQKRIIEEGKDCIADLYITADAGRLASSAKYGTMLKPIAELPVILHITVRATNQNAGVLKTSRPVQLDCS